MLEPFQSLRRDNALNFWTDAKAEPRNFRSCGRATALFVSFTLSLSLCVMKRVMPSITR